MFSQDLQQVISRALVHLDTFVPVGTSGYTRESLINGYWQFHQRFKAFKVIPPANSYVLDVGSGGGGLYFWKEYMEPVRTDLKMAAVDLFKGEHFDLFDKHSVMNLDEADFPFEDESFDYISMTHLIEHVQDWRALMKKCSRVLRPGGFVYIETPSMHTVGLPSRDHYIQNGFLCTTVNFFDDHTHKEVVNLDEVTVYVQGLDLRCFEKGFCRSPFFEDLLLSYGFEHKDIEVTQYGVWSRLLFSSYVMLEKL